MEQFTYGKITKTNRIKKIDISAQTGRQQRGPGTMIDLPSERSKD